MPTVEDLIRRAGRRREGMTVSEYRKRQRRLAWRDEDIIFLPPRMLAGPGMDRSATADRGGR